MFPGLSSRVEKDLKEIYVREKFDGDVNGLKRINICVRDPPRRKHGVFIGASFLANFAQPEAWISIKSFNEVGIKCFSRR
jgi:actin-related protein 2